MKEDTAVIETVNDIVERIMSAHWDMAACRCWACQAGREQGLAPRDKWLCSKDSNRRRYPVPANGWD